MKVPRVGLDRDERANLVSIARALNEHARDAALLGTYLALPPLHRDRIRRCLYCHMWFVDVTRNHSSLRCSKACTVRWSNGRRDGFR